MFPVEFEKGDVEFFFKRRLILRASAPDMHDFGLRQKADFKISLTKAQGQVFLLAVEKKLRVKASHRSIDGGANEQAGAAHQVDHRGNFHGTIFQREIPGFEELDKLDAEHFGSKGGKIVERANAAALRIEQLRACQSDLGMAFQIAAENRRRIVQKFRVVVDKK